MTKAEKTIVEIIKNKVDVMNIYAASDSGKEFNEDEFLERYRHELMGMLICLKNITTTERFYNIHFTDSGYAFGYYEDQRWHTIAE